MTKHQVLALIANETRDDPKKICWFEMRILVIQIQFRQQIEKIEETIDKIQFSQAEEQAKKKAVSNLTRQLKIADRDFYGAV